MIVTMRDQRVTTDEYLDEPLVEQPPLLAIPEPAGSTGFTCARAAAAATPTLPLSESARQAGLAGVARARQALMAAAERFETERAAARESRRAA
jgi:hypothetical protein